MGVRDEGGAMGEVELSGVDGCGASMICTWAFIELFCQLLWVLKIMHNKALKMNVRVYTLISNHRHTNEKHVILLCVCQIARNFFNDTTHCQRGVIKHTVIRCWVEVGRGGI